jgi:hypothetical protein
LDGFIHTLECLKNPKAVAAADQVELEGARLLQAPVKWPAHDMICSSDIWQKDPEEFVQVSSPLQVTCLAATDHVVANGFGCGNVKFVRMGTIV